MCLLRDEVDGNRKLGCRLSVVNRIEDQNVHLQQQVCASVGA